MQQEISSCCGKRKPVIKETAPEILKNGNVSFQRTRIERRKDMTLLDCAVTGCAYNKDRCCCKGDIKVEGSEAVNQNETCCGSFVERGEKNCGCNVKEHESKAINVVCEAGNCTFNKDKKCSADHIGIAGGDACSCGETECASFCCK